MGRGGLRRLRRWSRALRSLGSSRDSFFGLSDHLEGPKPSMGEEMDSLLGRREGQVRDEQATSSWLSAPRPSFPPTGGGFP